MPGSTGTGGVSRRWRAGMSHSTRTAGGMPFAVTISALTRRSRRKLRCRMQFYRSRLRHLPVQMMQIVQRSSRNSYPRRSPIQDEAGRKRPGHSRSALAYDHRAHRALRGHGSLKASRRPHIVNSAVPTIKSTWLPAPAKAGRVHPVSVVVRHPAPGICRSPHISHARIPRPGAIHKRIPTNPRKLRLPQRAVAGKIGKSAVII